MMPRGPVTPKHEQIVGSIGKFAWHGTAVFSSSHFRSALTLDQLAAQPCAHDRLQLLQRSCESAGEGLRSSCAKPIISWLDRVTRLAWSAVERDGRPFAQSKRVTSEAGLRPLHVTVHAGVGHIGVRARGAVGHQPRATSYQDAALRRVRTLALVAARANCSGTEIDLRAGEFYASMHAKSTRGFAFMRVVAHGARDGFHRVRVRCEFATTTVRQVALRGVAPCAFGTFRRLLPQSAHRSEPPFRNDVRNMVGIGVVLAHIVAPTADTNIELRVVLPLKTGRNDAPWTVAARTPNVALTTYASWQPCVGARRRVRLFESDRRCNFVQTAVGHTGVDAASVATPTSLLELAEFTFDSTTKRAGVRRARPTSLLLTVTIGPATIPRHVTIRARLEADCCLRRHMF